MTDKLAIYHNIYAAWHYKCNVEQVASFHPNACIRFNRISTWIDTKRYGDQGERQTICDKIV